MDFITSTILSGILYDMLKNHISITANNIKTKLKGWLVDEIVAVNLERELAKLELSDEMSESAIAKKLSSSDDISRLLASIQPTSQKTIIQSHSGTGDNVAGDKIIKH